MATRGRGKMPSGFQVIPYQGEIDDPKPNPAPPPLSTRPPAPAPPAVRASVPSPPVPRAPMPPAPVARAPVPTPTPAVSAYATAQNEPMGAANYKHIAFFNGMNDMQISLLINQAATLTLNSGDVVFREGIKEDTLFLLQMGRCNVAHAGRNIASLGAGTVFGEMALVSDRPRSATVTADRLCTLKVWDLDTLHTIFELDPDIGLLLYRNLAKILAQRLYRANVDKRNAGR